MMPTSCLPRSVAHAQRIGQEMLQLASRARQEGRLTEVEWQSLPATPEEMAKLILKGGAGAQTVDMLIRIYSDQGGRKR